MEPETRGADEFGFGRWNEFNDKFFVNELPSRTLAFFQVLGFIEFLNSTKCVAGLEALDRRERAVLGFLDIGWSLVVVS